VRNPDVKQKIRGSCYAEGDHGQVITIVAKSISVPRWVPKYFSRKMF